ncbi:MAG TPA: sugar ABC transporter permease [Candidatus Bathyarchaeota archaeon]|nr:sugar ABC transporter permease [Candidatus Bathyarchaeota archaeon]
MASRKLLIGLLLPAILVTGFAGITPMIALLNYCVQTPFELRTTFVGLGHFRAMFHDYRFTDAVFRSLAFAAIALAIEIPLGLGLAYLLRKPGVINSIITALIALPTLFPPVTIGMMWLLMARKNGPLGMVMDFFLSGMFDPFRNATHAWGTIILMDVWHWTGLTFLVSLAAVSAIDESYIISARTEGATRWQIFRYAEFPQLVFPLTFVSLLRLIDALKIFDEVYVLTGGGPGLSTEFITQYIRTTGIEQWIIGYASAMSLVFNFIVLILSWLMLMILTGGRGLIE